MDQVEIIKTAEYDGEWPAEELSQVELGDKRLSWRLRDSAMKLASPTECVNQPDKRLKPMIAVDTVIAWRLFWLTVLARTDPDAPASFMLASHELRALYRFHHKQPLPESLCPTVRQATRWIAQLGGFLDPEGDGEPGVTIIWRGRHRLNDISDAFLTFHHPSTYV